MKFCGPIALTLCLAWLGPSTGIASAAEIKVFTVRAGMTVLDKIRPEFEKATGHRLKIVYDPVLGSATRRINAGESFDVCISAPSVIDGLLKNGKVAAGTRTDLFRSGMGVEVRAGTLKPDIGSVEAFKQALINAKSIGYIPPNNVSGLIERLGLTDALRAKVTVPDADSVSERVASGQLELGIVVVTQVLTTPGVELVGPLPAELQYDVQFSAGISASSHAPVPARDLLKFLTGPVAALTIRSQGMMPEGAK